MAYNSFYRLFLTKSNKVLVGTITASQKREVGFTQSGNAAAAQIEIDRIQAAVDVLDSRGYYNGAESTPKPAQAGKLKSLFGNIDKKALGLVALAGLWFVAS